MEQISIARQVTNIAAWSRLTWLAMLLAALPVAIIIVPGDFVYDWPDETGQLNSWKLRSNELRAWTAEKHEKEFGHRATTLRVYEHGWPKPFLARAVVFNCNDRGQSRTLAKPWLGVTSWFLHWGGSKTISVSWSNYDVWPFYADGWIVDLWGLIIDGLVATAIVFSVGASMNWWLKSRRGKLWNFQLRDFLVLITFLAVCLGVYGYHTRIRTHEGLAGKWLPPGFKLHDGHMLANQSYCGPVWLRKLSGNRYFPQLFHHITHATIRDNDQWSDCYLELLNFPYLHTLNCRVQVPVAAFDMLERCRNLQNLNLTFKTNRNQSFTNTPTMGVAELYLLERLQLESIKLYGDQIEARHIKQLATLPKLKRMTLQSVSASDESIESIRLQFPSLTIEVLPDWDKLLGSPIIFEAISCVPPGGCGC